MFSAICFIIAAICFGLAAAGVAARVNLTALGLLFLTLAIWAPLP